MVTFTPTFILPLKGEEIEEGLILPSRGRKLSDK